MKVLTLVALMLQAAVSQLTCATDFLNSYGIDSSLQPRFKKMILCNGVSISCCSPFDEMRFHKSWFDLYANKLNATQTKIVAKTAKLAPLLGFFTAFKPDDYKGLLTSQDLAIVKAIAARIDGLKKDLDPELRSVANLWKTLGPFDQAEKQQLFCALCDARNQEFFLQNSYNRLLVNQGRCQLILNTYNTYLNLRAKVLNPTLLYAHKIISIFNFTFYNDNKRAAQLITDVKRNMDVINKCYPTLKAPFGLTECQPLCNLYSPTGESPAFAGETDFYEYIAERFRKFKEYLDAMIARKVEGKDSKEYLAVLKRMNSRAINRPIRAGRSLRQPKKVPAKLGRGRVLSPSSKIKRRITRAMKKLRKFKNLASKLKNTHQRYLKRIYRQSKKLARKSRKLLKARPQRQSWAQHLQSFDRGFTPYPFEELKVFPTRAAPFMPVRQLYSRGGMARSLQKGGSANQNAQKEKEKKEKEAKAKKEKEEKAKKEKEEKEKKEKEEQAKKMLEKAAAAEAKAKQKDASSSTDKSKKASTDPPKDTKATDSSKNTDSSKGSSDPKKKDESKAADASKSSNDSKKKEEPKAGDSSTDKSKKSGDADAKGKETKKEETKSDPKSDSTTKKNEKTDTSTPSADPKAKKSDTAAQTDPKKSSAQGTGTTSSAPKTSRPKEVTVTIPPPAGDTQGSDAATTKVYKAPKNLPDGQPTPQNYPFIKSNPDPNDPWQYNPKVWNVFDTFVSWRYDLTRSVLRVIGNNNLDLDGSFNCTKCENATCVANSTNVTHSSKILLSTNITSSFYVYNSTNLRRSFNVTNSSALNYSRHAAASRNGTRIRNSRHIINGRDVLDSAYCYNCTNCVNCNYCSNVTNGFNLTNVTNAYTVMNIINGTNLTYVNDSANVSGIYNGSGLVNASNCSYCFNNSNCAGAECNITKFQKELAAIVNKKLMEQSYTIIDQLYTFYRVGKVESYSKRNDSFDPELFRSQQKYFDLSTRNVLFEVDGIKLDYTVSALFREDPNPLKEAALQYLLKKEKANEDEKFNIVNKGGLDQRLVDRLNKEMDLTFLDAFNSDMDRVPISFKYVANRTEQDLQSEQEYYDSLAVDYQVTEQDKAGAQATPSTTTPAATATTQKTEAKKATRKLVASKLSRQSKSKKTRGVRHSSRRLKKGASKKHFPTRKAQRLHARRPAASRKSLKRTKYVVKKIVRKTI